MRDRRPGSAPGLGLVAALLSGILLPLVAPGATAAAEYTMDTAATYAVAPAEGRIAVSVRVSLTNTTPDPDGQFSLFDEAKLAVHDAATEVEASDDDGALEVSVAVENKVTVATVELRDPIRYEENATFSLTYVLPDSEDPQLRVRPSTVVFPAWGFGTSGTVEVTLPSGYDVLVDGDPLTREGDALRSGEIVDPTRWLALVTATRPTDHVTTGAAVPLAGGTADLVVRAFADDEAWGQRTLDLVTRALPLLEEELGLPYPKVGQLILSEAVAADATGFGEGASATANEIAVAFDQPPFTVLHQVAHVWLSPSFVEARWLREGLASAVAARVAERLEVPLPYDPAARAEELTAAAVRLDAWPEDAEPPVDAYGYAASWATVEEIAAAAGPDALRAVLGRVAASVGPYAPADVTPEPAVDGVASPTAPLTSRSFLDHLETVSGRDLAPLFEARVLSEEDAALLAERAAARESLAELVERANGWGAPDPVRAAMTDWSFADALRQIDGALAWLKARDALLEEMREVGLSAPDRLQQAYRSYGGGGEATAELEAMRAVADEYADTAAAVNRERGFLERIGLIGGPDPTAELNLAHGRFADGDLRGALDSLAEAQRIVLAAETAGIVRIASAVLVAGLVLGLAVLLVRRRASYTAAP